MFRMAIGASFGLLQRKLGRVGHEVRFEYGKQQKKLAAGLPLDRARKVFAYTAAAVENLHGRAADGGEPMVVAADCVRLARAQPCPYRLRPPLDPRPPSQWHGPIRCARAGGTRRLADGLRYTLR
jgi:hypothetical protein